MDYAINSNLYDLSLAFIQPLLRKMEGSYLLQQLNNEEMQLNYYFPVKIQGQFNFRKTHKSFDTEFEFLKNTPQLTNSRR